MQSLQRARRMVCLQQCRMIRHLEASPFVNLQERQAPLLWRMGGSKRTHSGKRNNNNNNNNPYAILGVPTTASLDTAQQAFLKLALRHHPDTTTTTSTARDEKKDTASSSSNEFVRIRQAFERIRNAKLGKNTSSDDDNESSATTQHNRNYNDRYTVVDIMGTEEEFLQWFHQHTGIQLTSLQRRELVQLYRSRLPGGRYDGPSWELARRLVMEQDAFLKRHVHMATSSDGGSRRQHSNTTTTAGDGGGSDGGFERAGDNASSRSSGGGAQQTTVVNAPLRRQRRR